ncbi:MAG: ribosomal-processing cysteine protease Prp [Bacilli bacterium]|jgi:uncharacterized protein YsxB (DUF464 family)
MVKVKVESNNGYINKVSISGHAQYDKLGKDIVCASVSSIAITSINAILSFYPEGISYQQSEGNLQVVVKEFNKDIDILLTNMVNMLKELERDYPHYIRIII